MHGFHLEAFDCTQLSVIRLHNKGLWKVTMEDDGARKLPDPLMKAMHFGM